MNASYLSALLGAAAVTLLAAPTSAQPNLAEPRVTLHLKDTPLSVVLEALSVQSGRTFIVSSTIAQRVAAELNVTDASLSVALAAIDQAFGVCSNDTGEVTRILPCDAHAD